MAGKKLRKRQHKVFKTFGILTAFVLVIGLTVAITLALLNSTSDTRKNTFVSDTTLDLELTEPHWTDPPGTSSPGDGKPEDGEEKAKDYTPGMAIPKDPTLTNTTTFEGTASSVDEAKGSSEYKNKSEYVALKLDYQILKADVDRSTNDDYLTDDGAWQSITYEEFSKLATIKYYDDSGNLTDGFRPTGSSSWYPKIEASGDYAANGSKANTVFYYADAIGPNITGLKNSSSTAVTGASDDKAHITKTLFDAVVVNEGLTQEDVHTFKNDSLKTSGANTVLFNGTQTINSNSWNASTHKTWSDMIGLAKDNTEGASGANAYEFTDLYKKENMKKPRTYTYTKNGTTTTTYVHVGLIPFRITVTGYAVQAYINEVTDAIIESGSVDDPSGNTYVKALNDLMGI